MGYVFDFDFIDTLHTCARTRERLGLFSFFVLLSFFIKGKKTHLFRQDKKTLFNPFSTDNLYRFLSSAELAVVET